MMIIKKYLQKLQDIIPHDWLYRIQYIHAQLVLWWILKWGNQPLKFSSKSAIIFSPHQDDETFGCGGAIALKRAQGISVVVIFLTDGRGASNSHNEYEIIKMRKQESLEALRILGVESDKIHFLDKLDGSLRDLNPEEKKQTIDQIIELLKYYQPEEIYVPHHKDCHRDHEASYYLVKEAIAQSKILVELWQYPIWLFWRAPLLILLKLPDIAAAHCLSITPVRDKKKQAIASYQSQINSLPPGFIKGFLLPSEIFFKDKY